MEHTVLRRDRQVKPLGQKIAGAAGAAAGWATGGIFGAIKGKEAAEGPIIVNQHQMTL